MNTRIGKDVMHTHNTTILLVDDEPEVLSAIEGMLEGSGYQLISKSDARSALSFLVQENEIIDLIITDFQMPGLDGLEFIDTLRKIQPTIPVIIFTGYGMLKRQEIPEHIIFVQKPVVSKELRAIILTALTIKKHNASS